MLDKIGYWNPRAKLDYTRDVIYAARDGKELLWIGRGVRLTSPAC